MACAMGRRVFEIVRAKTLTARTSIDGLHGCGASRAFRNEQALRDLGALGKRSLPVGSQRPPAVWTTLAQ